MARIGSSSTRVAFAPRRLAHGNFFCSDRERSTRFWVDVCGLTEVFEEEGIMATFLSNGSSHHDAALMQISLQARIGRGGHVQIPVGRGKEPGLNHLGWEMENEDVLVGAWERAKAAGLPIHRTANHQISHSVYLFDPEGNYLEFYVDASRDWRGIYRTFQGELITETWNPKATAPSKEALYDPDPTYDIVPDALIHPYRTSRAALLVDDFPGMVDFYEDVAGLRVLRRDDEREYAILGGTVGKSDLGIFGTTTGDKRGLHHFAFELGDEDEIKASLTRLKSHNIPLVSDVDNETKRSFALADPDGIVLEFFVPRSVPPENHDPETGEDRHFLI